MLHSRYRHLTPLILLFAWLQALAPAVAAIADARLLDDRTPYAHVESETDNGCVVVHQHDCALCSVATSANGVATGSARLPELCSRGSVALAFALRTTASGSHRDASQRAPPAARG